MMLRKLFLVVLICAFMAPTYVFASDKNVYFSGSIGLLFSDAAGVDSQNATLSAIARATDAKIEANTGIAVTGAVGMRLMPKVRGEVEYAYRTAGLDKVTSNVGNAGLQGDININSLMFNAYYDHDTASSWTPYVGGGLGVAWTKADGFGGLGAVFSNQTVSDVAYQVMAGLAYDVSAEVDLNVGYRYFGTSDADFTLLSASIDTHAIEFGMRYSF
jgi:outer membrane immunogenic protein